MTVEFFMLRSHDYTQARRFERVPAVFPVHVRSGELRVYDQARDVSEAGLGLETVRPLAPMTLVSLRLDVPHCPEPLDVLGRVMWATETEMGVRFEQPEPQLSDVVQRLRRDFERL